jgi:excisionase family DNA binding protein
MGAGEGMTTDTGRSPLPDVPVQVVYLTPVQVGERLHLHPVTVVAMCKRGELRHIKVGSGRYYRIPQTALDNLAEVDVAEHAQAQ